MMLMNQNRSIRLLAIGVGLTAALSVGLAACSNSGSSSSLTSPAPSGSAAPFPSVAGFSNPPSTTWKGVDVRNITTSAGADAGGLQIWTFSSSDADGLQKRIIARDTTDSYGGNGQKASVYTANGVNWYLTMSHSEQSIRYAANVPSMQAMVYVTGTAGQRPQLQEFIQNLSKTLPSGSASATTSATSN